MLFDPKPKERRGELFNRETELNELRRFVESGSPLILCLGVRRIGKTSVIKVFANEANYPVIYIDARRLAEYNYSKAGLYGMLAEEFTRIRGRFSEIIDYLKRIRAVSIGGYGVEFNWRDGELSLSLILSRMNEYAEDHGSRFVVVIDEAQELRFMKGYNRLDARQVLAYSYDNLGRVKFILTGSEVGLLYDLLQLHRRSSPLYGRAYDEVVINRFDRETSIEFLEAGFTEVGMNVQRSILEMVVESMDGIPGWLTLYGYEAAKRRNAEVIGEVLGKAIELALDELKKIAKLSNVYGHVLRAIAMGYRNWSYIKRVVEAWMGMQIHDETLRRALNRLIDMSIISKVNGEYEFIDPIYREASKRL